ncbi:MAG: isochorismatase family cysteine hydrolase [Candidatus Aenigmatarchaeota archaeon]
MKKAVIVIDAIKGMEKWVPASRMKKILPNIKKVLDKARAKKIPLIYIVHTPLGKKGTIIYDTIKPAKGERKIFKKKYSSFYNTSLDKTLKKMRVKRLVLTGVSTHWCVLATALDAHYRDYKITILKDCVTAPTEKDHRLALDWLEGTIDMTLASSKRW